jgi:hypothetical protein
MQAEILLTLKLQQKLFADPRRIESVRARNWRVSAIKVPGMPLMK